MLVLSSGSSFIRSKTLSPWRGAIFRVECRPLSPSCPEICLLMIAGLIKLTVSINYYKSTLVNPTASISLEALTFYLLSL